MKRLTEYLVILGTFAVFMVWLYHIAPHRGEAPASGPYVASAPLH